MKTKEIGKAVIHIDGRSKKAKTVRKNMAFLFHQEREKKVEEDIMAMAREVLPEAIQSFNSRITRDDLVSYYNPTPIHGGDLWWKKPEHLIALNS